MEFFGRTNTRYPKAWASLSVPASGFVQETPGDLVDRVREVGCPIDISSQPALWGSALRGGEDVLVQKATNQIAQATSEDHAFDLVQAHLIETLSSIGREYIDFYFLRFRQALEEFQWNGAFGAIEHARQEGHIRHIGLLAEGNPLATLGIWQFRDAFEVVWLPKPIDNDEYLNTLAPLAKERRVGVLLNSVTQHSSGIPVSEIDPTFEQFFINEAILDGTVSVTISSTNDLQKLTLRQQQPDNWEEMRSAFLKRFDADAVMPLIEKSNARWASSAREFYSRAQETDW